MPQWSDQFPWYIKQPIDQAAHLVVTFVGAWVIGLLLFQFVGPAWAAFVAMLSISFVAGMREAEQMRKREKRKYLDTALDVLFLGMGTYGGGISFYMVIG